jgi:hypothetical protein
MKTKNVGGYSIYEQLPSNSARYPGILLDCQELLYVGYFGSWPGVPRTIPEFCCCLLKKYHCSPKFCLVLKFRAEYSCILLVPQELRLSNYSVYYTRTLIAGHTLSWQPKSTARCLEF